MNISKLYIKNRHLSAERLFIFVKIHCLATVKITSGFSKNLFAYKIIHPILDNRFLISAQYIWIAAFIAFKHYICLTIIMIVFLYLWQSENPKLHNFCKQYASYVTTKNKNVVNSRKTHHFLINSKWTFVHCYYNSVRWNLLLKCIFKKYHFFNLYIFIKPDIFCWGKISPYLKSASIIFVLYTITVNDHFSV